MKGFKAVSQTLAAGTLALAASSVFAGPIIIAGTDADDHGSVSAGVNLNGWEFMQKALQNIAPAVSNGSKLAVCIGCNSGDALNAFNSAFNLSTLVGAGWTSTSLTTVAAITNFFNGTGAVNVNNTGIIYMPTVQSNVGGGITDAQLAVVNTNGATINNFVAAGGGLFTQEQANSTIGYGWLTSLLPGLVVNGDGAAAGSVFNDDVLQLSAAGAAAFPGLTNSEISAATPWHAFFSGTFGGLSALVFGNGDNSPVATFNDAVVLGGGASTVIVCGQPGTPACPPTNGVPEPQSLPLIALSLVGLLSLARRRKSLAATK